MVLGLRYIGRHLYQYNKDNILGYVLITNKFFSNYKFTRKQREAVNRQLLFVSTFISVETQQFSYNILFIDKLFHAFNAIISM